MISSAASRNIGKRIASVRVQVCPRTAYATAGSAATQLNVVKLGDANYGQVLENVLQTDEFETVMECDREEGPFSEGVHLVCLGEGGDEGDIKVALDLAQKLISENNVSLVFVVVGASCRGVDDLQAQVKQDGRAGISMVHDSYEGGCHLISCHASSLTSASSSSSSSSSSSASSSSSFSSSSAPTDPSKVSQWGSQGQPAVKSRHQFRYLWANAHSMGAEVGLVDCGKQRVLQRLVDRPVDGPTGQKWNAEEWDALVSGGLKEGKDDFGIYSLIRERITGRTLEQDLVVTLTADENAATSGEAMDAGAGEEEDGWAVAGGKKKNKNSSSSNNNAADDDKADEKTSTAASGGEGEGGDGRAGFMVKMTLECVPDDLKGRIGSVLDYGCAEGAITAELGRQLHLPSSRVYGADVRAIPADGFTFVQLKEEHPERAPGLGEVLPTLKDGSVMLVTSAMVMHHVRYPQAAMRELRRVVHPKGVVVMREHHCDSAEMAAFLDITHGLYSLAWSVPLEWPKYLEEYEAWYRSQEDWDQLMATAGFKRITDHFRINRHYDAAKHSRLKERDRRITNCIKAYYAAYLPDPTYVPASSSSAVAAPSAGAAAVKVGGGMNSMWGAQSSQPANDGAGAGAGAGADSAGTWNRNAGGEGSSNNSGGGAQSPKRSRQDLSPPGSSSSSSSRPAKRSAVESVLEAVESTESSSSFNNATSLEISSESIDVFESRSNRGFFYVPLQDGKTLWVSLFYLQALAEKGCEPHSLPVHPQKSPIPVSAHPVGGGAAGGEAVGFLDERRKKVMRVRKIVYAK